MPFVDAPVTCIIGNTLAADHKPVGIGTNASLNDRQWFMVRGISDYADSSYGHRWCPYAAVTAAAYVRALLAELSQRGLRMTNATNGSGRDAAVAEARSAARAVLTDLLEWRLPPLRWDRVAEIIQSLHDAVLDGDHAALDTATIDLELLSPIRITRVGSIQDKIQAPTRVRERVNRLQHILVEPPSPDEGDDRTDEHGRLRDQ